MEGALREIREVHVGLHEMQAQLENGVLLLFDVARKFLDVAMLQIEEEKKKLEKAHALLQGVVVAAAMTEAAVACPTDAAQQAAVAQQARQVAVAQCAPVGAPAALEPLFSRWEPSMDPAAVRPLFSRWGPSADPAVADVIGGPLPPVPGPAPGPVRRRMEETPPPEVWGSSAPPCTWGSAAHQTLAVLFGAAGSHLRHSPATAWEVSPRCLRTQRMPANFIDAQARMCVTCQTGFWPGQDMCKNLWHLRVPLAIACQTDLRSGLAKRTSGLGKSQWLFRAKCCQLPNRPCVSGDSLPNEPLVRARGSATALTLCLWLCLVMRVWHGSGSM